VVKGLKSLNLGTCEITVKRCGQVYGNVRVMVLNDLLTDVILGQDFMQWHQNVNIHFGGSRPTLNLNVLYAAVANAPVRMFEHLNDDCHPIATRERQYSNADRRFISMEVKRLLDEGLIEARTSPWGAQPLVITQENHKKRTVIDDSQTINKFKQLDAYPLSCMQDVVNSVTQTKIIFSTLNLTSAYHQI